MNQRLLSVLLFALVASAAATFLLYKVLGNRIPQQQQQSAVKVLVAYRQLDIGTLIKEGDLSEADWAGPITPDMLTKKEEIIGRGVVSAIYAGEPIRSTRLAQIGAGAGLAATIPVGMRAVAIRVNDIVGVAGFVTPGQRVDLLIMGQPPAGSAAQGSVSKTLLQHIEVLSAGQQIQKDTEGKPVSVPVVNLLVTPEQAEIVSLASNHAQIQLILRNPLDKEDTKTKGAIYGKLFTDNPYSGMDLKSAPTLAPRRVAPVAPAPQPKPVVEKKAAEPPPIIVEILHGGAKAQVSFKTKAEER
jgi:pilus assembly protein CpaB